MINWLQCEININVDIIYVFNVPGMTYYAIMYNRNTKSSLWYDQTENSYISITKASLAVCRTLRHLNLSPFSMQSYKENGMLVLWRWRNEANNVLQTRTAFVLKWRGWQFTQLSCGHILSFWMALHCIYYTHMYI